MSSLPLRPFKVHSLPRRAGICYRFHRFHGSDVSNEENSLMVVSIEDNRPVAMHVRRASASNFNRWTVAVLPQIFLTSFLFMTRPILLWSQITRTAISKTRSSGRRPNKRKRTSICCHHPWVVHLQLVQVVLVARRQRRRRRSPAERKLTEPGGSLTWRTIEMLWVVCHWK